MTDTSFLHQPHDRGIGAIMAQAAAAQPDHLKPELGHDVLAAGLDLASARHAVKACTEQTVAAVRQANAAGLPVKDCARLAGVTRRTIYKWLETGEG